MSEQQNERKQIMIEACSVVVQKRKDDSSQAQQGQTNDLNTNVGALVQVDERQRQGLS